MSLVVIVSPSERKSKELTITCICRPHSTRAAASHREMHRYAQCRWNRYSTRLRAAKGERGAVLLVGMEPALGRHELNSLKEKCIFPSYTFIVENKILRCILFWVLPYGSDSAHVSWEFISRKAHCPVADPMLSGFASILWFYLQKWKVWIKKFCN